MYKRQLFAYGRGYIDTISNPIHNTNECTLCERQSCAFPEFSAVCTCREIVGGLRKKLWANWRIHTGNSHPGPNHNHMYYIIIGQRRPYLNGAPCKSMKPRYWYQFCTLWKRWGTPSTSASRNLLIISERDPENSPDHSEFLYLMREPLGHTNYCRFTKAGSHHNNRSKPPSHTHGDLYVHKCPITSIENSRSKPMQLGPYCH